MSSDEFDSSSTLYECIVLWKFFLSYIGISELGCSTSAYELIGLYMSYRDLSWINFRLRYNFPCFVLDINSCTLRLLIAEAWNFKLHNNSLTYFLPQINYIYIYIYILYLLYLSIYLSIYLVFNDYLFILLFFYLF